MPIVVETCKATPVSERLLTAHGIFGAFSEMTIAAVLSARRRGAVLLSITYKRPRIGNRKPRGPNNYLVNSSNCDEVCEHHSADGEKLGFRFRGLSRCRRTSGSLVVRP